MSNWIENLLFAVLIGGVIVGSVQFQVRRFWENRTGANKKLEELAELRVTLMKRHTLLTLTEMKKQTQLLQSIQNDIKKG